MTPRAATTKRRHRRTAEEMVRDLEAQIAAVQRRAATREVKSSDEGRAFLLAVKAVDKAIEAAQAAGDQAMAHALESARATLGEHLIAMGIRAPQSRRGRRKTA